jgi:hypothetical protein
VFVHRRTEGDDGTCIIICGDLHKAQLVHKCRKPTQTSIVRLTAGTNIVKRSSRTGKSWLWIFVERRPPQATRTCPSHEQSPTIVTTPRRGGPQPPLVPSPTAAPNVVANSRRRRVPVFRLPRSCLQSSPIRACFSVIRTHWYCMRVSDCLHTSIYQNRYCSYQEHGLTIQNGESC